MIEFSDDLSTLYDGKEAIEQRVTTRLKHTTSDIPYYDRGVDIFEFTYGSKDVALRLGLRDFGASVSFDDENSRVQVYNVMIDTSKLL
jgi:hypothetical protein